MGVFDAVSSVANATSNIGAGKRQAEQNRANNTQALIQSQADAKKQKTYIILGVVGGVFLIITVVLIVVLKKK